MAVSELVCLRPGPSGGLAVPLPALRLLWDLEARGFALSQDGDTLIVRPHEKLTRLDCEQIRRWKWHVKALLSYVAPEAVQ